MNFLFAASNVALATQRSRRLINLLAERGVPLDRMKAEVGTLGAAGITEANTARRKAAYDIRVVH